MARRGQMSSSNQQKWGAGGGEAKIAGRTCVVVGAAVAFSTLKCACAGGHNDGRNGNGTTTAGMI